jgi:V/A-type H+/Na+-transporting ATPase subunit I
VSVAPVSKVHIFVHSGRKAEVLSALQAASLVHLEETKLDGAELRRTPADPAGADRTLARLKHALDAFSAFDETPGLKRMFSPRPALSLAARAEAARFDHVRVLDELERLESERSALDAAVRQLDRDADHLGSLREVVTPLEAFRGTGTAEVRLVSVREDALVKLEAEAAERPLWFEIISRAKGTCRAIVISSRGAAAEVEDVLDGLDAVPIDIEARVAAACPGERIEDLLAANRLERDRKAKAAKSVTADIKALAAHAPALKAAHDVLLGERERTVAGGLVGETDAVTCLEGWVRTADRERLERTVANASEAAEVCLREPLPDEDPPVLLENPPLVRPFEIITGLYGYPDRGILDPTLPLAPFFFIYVGLCITDGGYGFLVTALSLLYLKLARPASGARLFAKLALYLGLSNIVFGTFFGAWFGFPISSLLLIDPLKDPIPFLALSLGLGFVQVLVGTLLAMVIAIRNRSYAEAVVKGGWLALLPGLLLYLVTKNPVAGIAALLGAAGVVLFSNPSRNPFARFFGGLYGLYGISGYMSDTLSYSRILALGLSTGVIGMVINNLTQTVFRIPVAGWFLAPVMFVGGHLFNLGVGFLGGFVHSMRLQFVEFFTKFYKGGGRPFRPFRLESRYMDIVD